MSRWMKPASWTAAIGLGRLADEVDAAARPGRGRGRPARVHVRPFEKLHHQVLRPFGRQAVLEGLDDVGMLQAAGDFAFARLVEPFEAGLERGRSSRGRESSGPPPCPSAGRGPCRSSTSCRKWPRATARTASTRSCRAPERIDLEVVEQRHRALLVVSGSGREASRVRIVGIRHLGASDPSFGTYPGQWDCPIFADPTGQLPMPGRYFPQ